MILACKGIIPPKEWYHNKYLTSKKYDTENNQSDDSSEFCNNL